MEFFVWIIDGIAFGIFKEGVHNKLSGEVGRSLHFFCSRGLVKVSLKTYDTHVITKALRTYLGLTYNVRQCTSVYFPTYLVKI